jgi:hypothetical protein
VPAIPLTKAAQAISEEELQHILERKPIMPKENRPKSKGKDKKVAPPPKPAIRIAKPEMTLTGFEHTKENMKTKKRLNKQTAGKADPDSKSAKSESRRSRSQSVRSHDLRNPDSASETSSNHYQQTFAIDKADVPPMNQEIQDVRPEDMMGSEMDNHEHRQAECERPLGKDPVHLNPRNFAFMPSCFTAQIPAAGKLINKSANIKAVFTAC